MDQFELAPRSGSATFAGSNPFAGSDSGCKCLHDRRNFWGELDFLASGMLRSVCHCTTFTEI